MTKFDNNFLQRHGIQVRTVGSGLLNFLHILGTLNWGFRATFFLCVFLDVHVGFGFIIGFVIFERIEDFVFFKCFFRTLVFHVCPRVDMNVCSALSQGGALVFLSFSCRELTERILWEILKACIKKNGGSDRKKIKDL